MKILFYIDGPQTLAQNPPSSFTDGLLPHLCAALDGQELEIWGFGLERPAGLDLPGNPHWEALPVNNGIAGWWWKSTGLARRVRKAAPDRLVLVNPSHIPKWPGSTILSENNSDFTIPATTHKARGVREVLQFGAFAPGSPLPGTPAPGITSYLFRPAAPGFGPADYAEMEATRLVHTGGRSFFLYIGALDAGVMDLVKAFSIFKKRQKSDWKLVLAGNPGTNDRKFIESLQYYKYKDDLVIHPQMRPDLVPALVAAAYAIVIPPRGHGNWLPEAFTSGVTAIVPDQPAFHGDADEALVFYDGTSVTDIAENMMTIYKDENLRNRKKEAGLTLAAGTSWQDLAIQIATHLRK